jgi:hypothetical protein
MYQNFWLHPEPLIWKICCIHLLRGLLHLQSPKLSTHKNKPTYQCSKKIKSGCNRLHWWNLASAHSGGAVLCTSLRIIPPLLKTLPSKSLARQKPEAELTTRGSCQLHAFRWPSRGVSKPRPRHSRLQVHALCQRRLEQPFLVMRDVSCSSSVLLLLEPSHLYSHESMFEPHVD